MTSIQFPNLGLKAEIPRWLLLRPDMAQVSHKITLENGINRPYRMGATSVVFS